MTWEDAIESYKTYLILEKSLSSNSVEAYLNDIKKLAKYCADKHHVTTPDAISYDHLKDYLMFINEVGVTNRTQARCISSIRSFYKFSPVNDVVNILLQMMNYFKAFICNKYFNLKRTENVDIFYFV